MCEISELPWLEKECKGCVSFTIPKFDYRKELASAACSVMYIRDTLTSTENRSITPEVRMTFCAFIENSLDHLRYLRKSIRTKGSLIKR
jgi:hypothetical protein